MKSGVVTLAIFLAESWEGATDDCFASLRQKHLLDKINHTS
jgi:hypothetical protein